jgi:ankyrin repeat protein
LHLAARHGNLNIVKLLLPHYSNPLTFRDGRKRNALHLAVRFASLDMIELICNHIRATNHLDNCLAKGETRAESGQRCSCHLVYPHLDDTEGHGYTALHIGVDRGFHSAVSLLLHCSKSIADTPLPSNRITPELLLLMPGRM